MTLLTPTIVNNWHVQSRIVMAPMTRGFADGNGIIHPDTINYYTKRAKDGIGMLITEGISISPESKGTVGIPGLYTDNHTKAWSQVTNAVHKEKGIIVAQLWHVGRLTNSFFTEGIQPVAPSAIQAKGSTHKVKLPYEKPKMMSQHDINKTIQDYVLSAKNALRAGFDGIEIHAAQGYLIDQFHSSFTNNRTDEYGKNKYLFLDQIIQSIAEEIGSPRVIVRFSEHKDDCPEFNWKSPEKEVQQLTKIFKRANLQLIHPSAQEYGRPLSRHTLTFHQLIKEHWDKSIIGVGNFTPQSAEIAIKKDDIEMAAFGRALLANPDFVHKLKTKKRLSHIIQKFI